MALREIIKKGDPVLEKHCHPVTRFDQKLWDLLDDMRETLLKSGGVGLAAPQVGTPGADAPHGRRRKPDADRLRGRTHGGLWAGRGACASGCRIFGDAVEAHRPQRKKGRRGLQEGQCGSQAVLEDPQ